MKLCMIVTGGTIGSTLEDHYISLDKKKGNVLLDLYQQQFGDQNSFTVVEPFSMLSENSSGHTIGTVCKVVKEEVQKGYDGIIVTHGTDTLQYTAAVLSYALGICPVPVCLVSSNYPLEDVRANGLMNFHGAVKLIEAKAGSGVFVVYKNQKDLIKVHRGTRLLEHPIYSDEVYSVLCKEYGYFTESFGFQLNKDYKEYKDAITPFAIDSLKETCKEVMVLTIRPGLHYPGIEEQTKCILLVGYHSGTINTADQEALTFYKKAREYKIPVYVIGANKEADYECTTICETLEIIPIYGLTTISAYCKAWLCIENGLEFKGIMEQSLGGDLLIESFHSQN